MNAQIVSFAPRGARTEHHAPAPMPAAGRAFAIGCVALLVAAFVLRFVLFGDPLIDSDENFYLLVGDRMLHGAVPYVDIWDRKPIGLFLIYAGIRLFGGMGIVQYQVVATLFAAGTAMVAARIALRMAGLPAAIGAGVLYLAMLGLAGGEGGQGPVFYNMFTAGAALATLEAARAAATDRAHLARFGALAMLLAGIAMQVKSSVVFEGMFFGIVLLHRAWRDELRLPALAGLAALWIGIALLPGLIAFAVYAALGHADAFLYANIFSILKRGNESVALVGVRLFHTWTALQLPMAGVLLAGLLDAWRRWPRGPETFRFVLMWLAAAFAGYFAFGTFFDHYALPLMLPIAIGCAPLFDVRRRRIGLVAMIVMLGIGTIATEALAVRRLHRHGGARETAALVAAIRPRLTNCMYVFSADVVLYHLTGSCLPTRWAYPSHLYLNRESVAVGVDQLAELRRIMATRPSVIVDKASDDDPVRRMAAVAIVHDALRRFYRPVTTVNAPNGDEIATVYERLPGR